MLFLPPHTVEEKVAALRECLPGVNLYNFLKGMPTALARSKNTVPRGMSQLKEVGDLIVCILEAQVSNGVGWRQLYMYVLTVTCGYYECIGG